MTQEWTFVHDARPQVKQRPRLGRRRKAYTPYATLEAEGALANSYDGPRFDGPVAVEVDYYVDRQVITIREWDGGVSPLRGDIDNLVKLTLDGLQKAGAFENDKAVMSIWAEKHPRD